MEVKLDDLINIYENEIYKNVKNKKFLRMFDEKKLSYIFFLK